MTRKLLNTRQVPPSRVANVTMVNSSTLQLPLEGTVYPVQEAVPSFPMSVWSYLLHWYLSTAEIGQLSLLRPLHIGYVTNT